MLYLILFVLALLAFSESKYSKTIKQKGGVDTGVVVAGLLLLAAVGGFLVWYFMFSDSSPSPSPSPTPTPTPSPDPTSSPSPNPTSSPSPDPTSSPTPTPSPTSPWCDIISIPIPAGLPDGTNTNHYHDAAYHKAFTQILYGDEAKYENIKSSWSRMSKEEFPPDKAIHDNLYKEGEPYRITSIDKKTADSICGLTCDLLNRCGMSKETFCEIKDKDVITDNITREHIEKYCDCKKETEASSAKKFQDIYECCPNAYKRTNQGCDFAVEDVMHQIRIGNAKNETCEGDKLSYCIKGQDILPVEEGDQKGAAVREKKRLTDKEYEIMCNFDEGNSCKKSCGGC